MQLFLDSGDEYQIKRGEDKRFQSYLRHAESEAYVAIGAKHDRFIDAFGDLMACELSVAELDSLNDLRDVINDLAFSTDDWFRQHDEYLTTL
ncbi:hypothetical protein [Pasteurella bettyae]|uniref:Uncharacterized protein n=1 Tax=Pasteurella bettyae CCUG 2042 TaxID=1095749 RepID=I3DKA4_9PAST|nr:hypothetical protein [Pasteurella bettyae]EIJ72147.1 hypothetical protein HMPREF1052_2054 [Pasteurella bettyae CCUG 2042]SUB20787.1 Uncharacterised protein [Pasteurella bettyae]